MFVSPSLLLLCLDEDVCDSIQILRELLNLIYFKIHIFWYSRICIVVYSTLIVVFTRYEKNFQSLLIHNILTFL